MSNRLDEPLMSAVEPQSYLHILFNDFVFVFTEVNGSSYREYVLTQYFLARDKLLSASCSEKYGRVSHT